MSRTTVHWLTQRLPDVPRHNAWLSPLEREVLESKRILKRRSEWRLGRWTAKRAIAAYLTDLGTATHYSDIEIRAAADGAPEAFLFGDPLPVALSISHSHGVAMCAVADADVDVGCDTEHIEPRSDVFASDYFATVECDLLAHTEPERRALLTTLIWSAKESVLKAVREGLRRNPREVVIELSRITPEKWNSFRACCARSPHEFNGWWRVAEGHVYTVVKRTGSTLPVAHSK